jgi:hypothetical protein
MAGSRKDACAPQRIGHSSDENVSWSEGRAAKILRGSGREETMGAVAEDALSNIGELSEPNLAVWVLILRLNPIAINEDTVPPDEIADTREHPT